jgi:3-oxoacyl-[acyl-carrier protein] reductase
MRTAVVTGAGRGLGKAIALRLAAEDHRVIAVDIDEGTAKATAEAVGGASYGCDVADRTAVLELASEIGPVEVLINNAGIWRMGPVLEQSGRDIDDVVGVNLLGTLYCCQAFAPGMAQLGDGRIVNFSSAAAAMRAGGTGIYTAAKGAIEILTQQFAGELGPSGIRVNAVAPGFIVTEGSAGSYAGERESQRTRAVPLRRVGAPDDIANVVSFLVSDQSSYVSGQVIAVDGGLTAARPTP